MLYAVIVYLLLGVLVAELALRSRRAPVNGGNAYPIIVVLWLPFLFYVVYNGLRRGRRRNDRS